MIEAVKAGLTASCLFGVALLMAICTVMTVAPGIREWWRKFKGRDAVEKAVGIAAATIAILYGGTKPVQNKGADAGIALVEVAVEYDSTNDVTAVKVSFTGHNVTTATPVSVRNDQRENWRELVKIGATVTSDLATNLLAFAVSGNVATNRFWWVGTETPAVIIETQGITITNFVASSKSVRIAWTCDDPKATVFAIQRRRKKPVGIPYNAEVSFLRSNAGSYIRPGVSIGAITSITCRVRCNYFLGAYKPFFGAYSSEQHDALRLILQGASNGAAWITANRRAQGSINVSFGLNVWHNVSIDCVNNRCIVDGVVYTSATPHGTALNSELTLFGLTGSSGVQVSSDVYIAAFGIVTSSGTVYDLIPVRVGNVGYMYDRVSGRLFGNAGAGAFAYGSDTLSYDWETVDTTSADTYTFEGFTIGEDWEWRIMSTYTEGEQ